MAKKKTKKKVDKERKKAVKKARKKPAIKVMDPPKTDILPVPMPPVEPPKISDKAQAILKDLQSHSLGAALGRCGPSG
jgi:hypothetical protein